VSNPFGENLRMQSGYR